MINKLLVLLLLSFFSLSSFGYEVREDSIPEKKELPKQQFYGPTIGLGVGMFKFYGDILDAQRGNALISNIGYDLHVKQQINPFLTTKFYVLFGSLSANERSIDRNLNFKSQITVGGFALMYNFHHILPEKRVINPFISLGIESVEFLSKTDLYDSYGNKYNYWSDGSIRNLPESDVNASDAVIIHRDYVYETDLREMNSDGKGKYQERTFSIPVGIGAQMHLTKNIDFSIGATMHYTFSDLVDNVTSNSGGERIGSQPGNKGNDKFLMSSFSISYNFLKHKKEDVINTFDEDIDYLTYDNEDEDGDGVIDFIDECPWTPEGVEVDDKGCPLDRDTDFVPNYKDDELESREGMPVSPNGVEMTDEMIDEIYQRYLDSTGVFADIENKLIAAEKAPKNKVYRVQVGSFTEAIDADLVDKFLSIPDVEIKTFGDSLTVIAVGNYDNLPEALKRKMELTKQGFDAAIVVTEEKDGKLISVGDEANNMAVENQSLNSDNPNELLFRIQLGAFSKKQPINSFNKLTNIMEIKADDGLYKYLYSGSYKTIEEAASQKLDLAIDYGVNDAFIVAYKGGKRIPLTEAGVKTTHKENIINKASAKYDKAAISFKIQVGIYKNQLPTEVLSKFIEIGDVDQKMGENDLTRYTVGNFKTLDEAENFKKEIIEKGIGGAFVIALHEEKLIPVNKAIEILEGE
ncbi:SPOR domain-containing protein [Vicingus serpentipes]|uniref:SPOR domain-containing protein n=1 Tax=Vicingus serpentipes TaxID=1926625 RepID=A0A5C6RWN0_9FLAO|nr:SPOR domain-containing protein [Vicingus serpentipes]TXB66748.1 SPOR domain-containing protein [Vicingus serpentipes]